MRNVCGASVFSAGVFHKQVTRNGSVVNAVSSRMIRRYMINMSISMNKQYRTRDGRPVRLLCVDRKRRGQISGFPICGLVEMEGTEYISWWSVDGVHFAHSPQEDLIEIKPHIKRELWVNVYDNGAESHNIRRNADFYAGSQRLACVKVEIDCEEGEGL